MTLALVCQVFCPSALSELTTLAAEDSHAPNPSCCSWHTNMSCVLHHLYCV